MAGSLTPAGGGRRGRGRSGYRPLSEINVTPFVDVMLVLLIVFMVAAPLLTVGVPVELPKTRSGPISGDTEPLTITMQADGTVYLQETPVDVATLGDSLRAIAEGGYDQRIFFRGDKAVPYGLVMQVTAAVQGAGFTRLAFLTETPPQPAE
ncbi:MAG: biopolymer transporter ExbD [Alphaproteobacteria bacterium]|nr:biopolymer transporter ExbD [Alphaproteobacteria bacterium]